MDLAAKIRTQILTGKIKSKEFLLPDGQLAKMYTISRNVVRQPWICLPMKA
jgi:DNA-binding FadR family transcriptional regulator